MAVITTPTFLNTGTFGLRQAQAPSTASMSAALTNGGIAFPFIADATITCTTISTHFSSIGTTFGLSLTVGIQADSGGGIPSGTFLTNGSVSIPANTFATAINFTASSGSPTITTAADHYLTVGSVIQFANTTGGVSTGTNYFVVSTPSTTTFTISTSALLTPVFSFSAAVTSGANTFTRQSGWIDIALTGASLTQGSAYWIVWQFSSTGSGTINFFTGYSGTSTQSVIYGLGYATRIGATWSKTNTTRGVAVAYSDGTSWYGTLDVPGFVNSQTLNNNDRVGVRFTVPANHPDILIDQFAIGISQASSANTTMTWKCDLYTDTSTPTLIASLSAIDGTVNANSSTQYSTVFQTNGTQWLTAGTSYLFMVGYDITPTNAPTRNIYTNILPAGRRGIIGAYGGDFILNWQGLNTWFLSNPDVMIPWALTIGALRFENSGGGGGGGFYNATSGFAGIGGN